MASPWLHIPSSYHTAEFIIELGLEAKNELAFAQELEGVGAAFSVGATPGNGGHCTVGC